MKSPGPARVGAIPRGSHYAHLGPQEEPKRGRKPEEVVSTFIQNWQLFVYVGALWGPI